ncbi:choice-of-anchor P family protein [Actinokineospora enzanensis]|uniref:choice-of-anchor P family protein n=1 Tax=Actinokineospora enzanensis TaxID=155975 RepID=UPI00037166EF|nr:choice-of-anchor P family protein [Actinokineospora enzanensis]
MAPRPPDRLPATGGLALAVATAAGAITALACPAAADPGVPHAPVTVFAEDFENGLGVPATLLPDYTGAPPLAETYAADPAWLHFCNGFLITRDTPNPPGSGCGSGPWANLQAMSAALGQWSGGDPDTNHAVTAYTDGANPGPDKVQLETRTPIPLPATNRFLAFSVDGAERNCFANHARFAFYLLDGDTPIATFDHPIEPCAAPQQVIGGTAVGTYHSDAPVLVNSSAVGIRLVNQQASGVGNDAAFDNVRILDVTPQLDVVAPAANVTVGTATTLTYTVTNTSELTAKAGWSFGGSLPAGLAWAGTPSSSCATVVADGRGFSATGSLAAGVASCDVSLPVTAARVGSYTTCAGNLSVLVGLDPPGCATVRVVGPVLAFNAYAHGGTVDALLVHLGPIAPADYTCTTGPGSSHNSITGTGLPGGSLSVISNDASGAVDANGLRTSRAVSSIAALNSLGGLVTADEIRTEAVAAVDAGGQVTATGGVSFHNLRVNGVPVAPGLSVQIVIPLVGNVTVDERTPFASGAGMSVNAIHIRLLTGVDVVIGHARAALGTPCP